MPTLTFPEARRYVLDMVRANRSTPAVEETGIDYAGGRILARDIPADRDYPPLARSLRDGFAVRAADLPGKLRIVGEVRAGESYQGEVCQGEAVEIMTGAPVPPGADAIVMVEHTVREGDTVLVSNATEPGRFINPRGAEVRDGQPVVRAGTRIDYAAIAMLAAVGRGVVPVYCRPVVSIIPTGDEIVEAGQAPRDYQIRNSNAGSLAEQVRRAGGIPHVLPVARDEAAHTRAMIERGLAADMMLLSGGVSAGKYDIVERVLADLGAEFFFDRVLIQPGQPLVFGRAARRFFFGLPGNPASTMVTFELFARAALELLAGLDETMLPMPLARLTTGFRHSPGLTRFLPARLSPDGAEVTPVTWRGSSDVPAVTRANAYLVADPARAEWLPGELIPVLLK
ncbi:MAG TPA: gephyrin-like molybdotransferase Glp [Bryobacteraceae bacterium]|nr:gephyrin-like molybdotransferase Glp [Bryobacteraceae bacterium]